jgi:hypothetical protein
MEHEDKRDNGREACGQDHFSRLIANAAPAIRESVFERPDAIRKPAGLDDDAPDRVMALAEAGTPRKRRGRQRTAEAPACSGVGLPFCGVCRCAA